MPGADANPYLAFAAMLAAGMAGIDEGWTAATIYRATPTPIDKLRRCHKTMREAAELLARQPVRSRALSAMTSLTSTSTPPALRPTPYDNAVTDWERVRYFERI